MSHGIQRTLLFLKPDTFETRNVGRVIKQIEAHGFEILAMRMFKLDQDVASQFYAVHQGKPFFEDLIRYISRGPILALVLRGENAILKAREMMGATDPKEADSKSIRGQFGSSLDANVVHGSDAGETAEKEIAFFFSEKEILP